MGGDGHNVSDSNRILEKSGLVDYHLVLITLRAERRSAPCCTADSREVSSRQQGAEWQLERRGVSEQGKDYH